MDRKKLFSSKEIRRHLAEEAARGGVDIECVDLISVDLLAPSVIRKSLNLSCSVLAFTSANAVAALARLDPGELPVDAAVYCVEGRTADAVREVFPAWQISGTARNARELAGKILDDGLHEVCFFCGDIRRDELPSMLRQQDVSVHEFIVYRTLQTPAKLDTNYDGYLFFSPSSVRSFFSSNNMPASAVCFAVGDTTAEAIRSRVPNPVLTSNIPRQEHIIRKIINHFEQ